MYEDWFAKNGIKEWGLVWTKRQENRLIRLYKAEIPMRQIASRMHRTEGGCAQRLAKLEKSGRVKLRPSKRGR